MTRRLLLSYESFYQRVIVKRPVKGTPPVRTGLVVFNAAYELLLSSLLR